MTHKTEVSLKIPNIEDLCCINCKVIPSDKQDTIVKSLFHSQVLTCRLIIYSVRCCVASPSIQNVGDSVHVVVSRKFFTTGKLQEHLNELNIKFSDPEEVHPKIYEACLKYTFTFKIAPHWNLIGTSLYLRGCNFLPFPPAIDAIEWNVHYKDDDTKLELKPMKLNIHTLTLEFLKIPSSILENFISNPNCTVDTINLTLFPCPWVYVLPKLTRARLISVSRTLPEKCPFDTYNDLRRHWKNMYSYRLPKTSDGMLFYEVVFPSYPNEPFIYPEACLLSKTPEYLTCENKNEIASGFLKDLAQNVHAVCGDVIHIGHIYPTLNVEYSCSSKNKYGREYEEILNKYKSPFFRTPNECIIIPTHDKPNLSSKIIVQGMDKMKTPMRNHTQQVLTIMDNHKRNRKPQENSRQYLSQLTAKNKDKRFGTQKFSQSSLTPPEIDEPTVISNTADILSYYDIPSMYPKRPQSSETAEENKDMPEKNKENSNSKNVPAATHSQAPYLKQQSSHSKPVIKNVENVHFDLSAIKKTKTNYKSSRQNDKTKNVKTDQFKKTTVNDSFKTPNSVSYTPNSFERIKETFFPSQKSKPHYEGFQNFDFRNQIESFNSSQPQVFKSSSQTTKTSEKNKNIETESNDDIRKELADFDKYNLGNKNKIGERIVSNQGHNFSFESAKKQQQKLSRLKNQTCGDKTFKLDDSDKVSEQSKFHQLNEEFNSTQNLGTSSNLSPSLLDSKRNFTLHTIDQESLSALLREEQSPENSEPCKTDTDEEEEEIQCSPSFLDAVTKYFDSPKHDNQMDFEESDPSIKTYTNNVSKEKMSQKRKATEADQISDNFSFYRNQDDSYNISPISTPCTDIYEGSINRKLLQTCKSPLSIFSRNEFKENNFSEDLKNDKENVFNNPQYSPSIFEKYESERKTARESNYNQSYRSYFNRDVQDTKSVKSSEIQGPPPPSMEVDNSDFLSILSQSSNESNSEKYESYKQACTEALTFN